MSKFDFNQYEEKNSPLEKLAGSFWKKYDRWEEKNKGLYLWSSTKGSGKTFLACCLAVSVQVKHRKRIRFVSTPEYLEKVAESYKRDQTQQDILYAYRNCDLLVLDDFGSEKRGEWQNQELFKLIDYRLNNGKPIIVTANYEIADLKCDGRIIDRLNKMCLPIHFPEVSIRQRKANEENKKFIQEILR